MNRADKALEPSMEDILASIRRIISDEDMQAPQEQHAQHLDREPLGHDTTEDGGPAGHAQQAMDASSEDDVLDLTDELVFAGLPAAGEASNGAHADPAPAPPQAPAPRREAAPEPLPAGFPPPSPGKSFSNHSGGDKFARPAHGRDAGRADGRQQGASQVARPVWSRRELPKSPPTFSPETPADSRRGDQEETRRDGRPASPEPRPRIASIRAWAQDIQMPVPDQGPLPLLAEAEPQYSPSPEPDDDTAVAALAQDLAKSAVVALEDEELASAQHVDFEALDAEQKAEVSERFADAMPLRAPENPSPPPGGFLKSSVLDQVLRQDFAREDALQYAPEEENALPAQDDPAESPQPEAPAAPWKSAPAWAENEREDAAFQPLDPMPQNREHTALPIRDRREDAPHAHPVAQAQFMGAAPPPAAGGKSLEDSVRDMLRPLLVQWLNENMPRILENAIREEIATRGIFPSLDHGEK